MIGASRTLKFSVVILYDAADPYGLFGLLLERDLAVSELAHLIAEAQVTVEHERFALPRTQIHFENAARDLIQMRMIAVKLL